jgi:hypothetical protein
MELKDRRIANNQNHSREKLYQRRRIGTAQAVNRAQKINIVSNGLINERFGLFGNKYVL